MDRAAAARRRDRVLQASSGESVRLGSVYEELERSARPMTRRRMAALFPGYRLELHRETVVSPLARRLGALAPVGSRSWRPSRC